jgi:hypothetical protein
VNCVFNDCGVRVTFFCTAKFKYSLIHFILRGLVYEWF